MKKFLLLTVMAVFALSLSAMADEAVIRRTDYEGMGVVEVEFTRDVNYKDLQITVLDAQQQPCEVTVLEVDDDDLRFQVENTSAGSEYSFTISGVRAGRSGDYGSVSGSFAVPGNVSVGPEGWVLDGNDLEVERDNGRLYYEGTINVDGVRYEVKVDAETGKVVEWERD